MQKKELWRGITSVLAVLLAIVIPLSTAAFAFSGMINNRLNVQTSRVEEMGDGEPVDTAYYKSEYGDVNNFTMDNLNSLLAAEEAHIITEMEEGSVLLKNEGNALPLADADGKTISLLGYAAFDPLYKPNSGGATVNQSRLVTLKSAFEQAGYTVNPVLWSAYEQAGSSRGGSFGSVSYATGEYGPEVYSSQVTDSFSQYGDVAVVVFARSGGEGRDLPISDTESNNGKSHLALLPNEISLMEMVKQYKDNGTFKKVVVLLNAGYAMEVEWLNAYGVDACLWIAGPGVTGFTGVVNVLTGKANPSGRLVDTFAADSLSSPAVQNAGDFTFLNAAEMKSQVSDPDVQTAKYLVAAEGIYIGYRYYETRYEDCILGQGNADGDAGVFASAGGKWSYADEVTYPFGYGLSYTTFEQKIVSLTENQDNTLTAVVSVRNTGSVAGKDVVQLYVQTPYTRENIEHKVEKSAIQLVGFGKTRELKPQEEQQITITVDKYLLASYDSVMEVEGEKGCYVLDAGDYYFAIGHDAHDALNNVLAAKGASGMVDHEGNSIMPDAASTTRKWVLNGTDTESYSHSQYTGTRVSNQFEDVDINYWQDGAVTYLTRSDWQATFPKPVELSATPEMIKAIDGYTYVKPEDAPSVTSFKQGVENGLTIVDMKGVPYDDPLWEEFVNQFSIDEMAKILIDQLGTEAVSKVSKPSQTNTDGPDGAQMAYMIHNETGALVNTGIYATAYPNEVVLASTWNADLITTRGSFLGEDALITRTAQLWSPGADIHRTPFSGRNFEYYSEDSYLSYLCSGLEVKAMTDKGVNTAIKHFASNDQETNRSGMNTFMTEQTFRQSCLRGFEGAFTIGKCMGTMTALNRLGCTYAGASGAMLNNVLRGEWGFHGVCITDAATASSYYVHTIECVVNGIDMFCMSPASRTTEVVNRINQGDGYVLKSLRDINHNFYYAFANSNLINGVSSNMRIIPITPWWQTAIIGLNIGLGVLTLVALAVYLITLIRSRKKA